MFIVDKDLKKLIDQNELQIIVDDENPPFNPLVQIGASSIDLRLSRVFRKYKPEVNAIDLTQEEEMVIIELPLDGELIIQPGEFLLGLTVEVIRLPANISGFIAARSSIARLGLSVVEQPLIHPGYAGSVALQLKNNIDRPIRIKPMLAICQVMFLKGTDFAEKPYGSGNTGKYFNEFMIPRPPQVGVEPDENRQTEGTLVDFAFVTALPKERDAVLKYLDVYERVQVGFEPLTYYRGRINISRSNDYYEVVVVMLLGMGNGEAAVGSMEVLRRWRPANVIMVGIAGGVPDKVALGDVVVANFVFYYELVKITSKGGQRRGQYFPSDRLLYDRALAHEANGWASRISTERPDTLQVGVRFPRVHFGAIASGEKILADETTLAQLLHECPDLFAVAMEGAGVARAASHQTPPTRFLEVRSICDYGDEQKNDDWQAYAAEAAAAFTTGLLRSRPVPPICQDNHKLDLVQTR
jgi:deoxycytidine triphosphate deaminase